MKARPVAPPEREDNRTEEEKSRDREQTLKMLESLAFMEQLVLVDGVRRITKRRSRVTGDDA